MAPRSPSSALCPLSWSGWAHALQAGTDLPDPDPPASRRETLWEVQEKLMSFLCSVWFLVDEEFAMKPVNNSQQRKSTGSHEAAGMRGTRLHRCTASWRVEVPCGLVRVGPRQLGGVRVLGVHSTVGTGTLRAGPRSSAGAAWRVGIPSIHTWGRAA